MKDLHELKTLTRFYEKLESGEKNFELRRFDRKYKVGDILILKDWDGEKYTGKELYREVMFILSDAPEFGLYSDYCAMALKNTMLFSPVNLLAEIDKIGAWSIYGLATEAIRHYFPDEYDENDNCSTEREVQLIQELGFNTWQDVVIKYHNEVGYKCDGYFNPEAVNER